MDPRPGAIRGYVNEAHELAYLRAGMQPPWERVCRAGLDITDCPGLWTPYERERREEFVERVERYRREGRL